MATKTNKPAGRKTFRPNARPADVVCATVGHTMETELKDDGNPVIRANTRFVRQGMSSQEFPVVTIEHRRKCSTCGKCVWEAR